MLTCCSVPEEEEEEDLFVFNDTIEGPRGPVGEIIPTLFGERIIWGNQSLYVAFYSISFSFSFSLTFSFSFSFSFSFFFFLSLDRALCLPTFSHCLIVNKTSLFLSP